MVAVLVVRAKKVHCRRKVASIGAFLLCGDILLLNPPTRERATGHESLAVAHRWAKPTVSYRYLVNRVRW